MGKLEKVIVENGITYVLGKDDIYYPDLQLPEGTNYNIGKFGHMRCEYLKEFRHGYYIELLLEGKLNEYLHDIDEECHEMLDRIVEKMKEKQGVTEKLKAENQMMWAGKMNNIIVCATTSCPASTKALSVPTAKSGVPINITFTIPHPPFQYQEAFLQPYQHTLLHQDGLFHEEDILQEGLHPQLQSPPYLH